MTMFVTSTTTCDSTSTVGGHHQTNSNVQCWLYSCQH